MKTGKSLGIITTRFFLDCPLRSRMRNVLYDRSKCLPRFSPPASLLFGSNIQSQHDGNSCLIPLHCHNFWTGDTILDSFFLRNVPVERIPSNLLSFSANTEHVYSQRGVQCNALWWADVQEMKIKFSLGVGEHKWNAILSVDTQEGDGHLRFCWESDYEKKSSLFKAKCP